MSNFMNRANPPLRDLAGACGVGAGQADLAEPDLVLFAQRLTATHDPGRDRAWAWDRCWHRYGSAVSKSRDVSADRLNRPTESTLTDFTEEPAGVRAAGEGDVRLHPTSHGRGSDGRFRDNAVGLRLCWK